MMQMDIYILLLDFSNIFGLTIELWKYFTQVVLN